MRAYSIRVRSSVAFGNGNPAAFAANVSKKECQNNSKHRRTLKKQL